MKILFTIAIAFAFTLVACSDSGTPEKYNTPKAEVLKADEYPLKEWRQEHEHEHKAAPSWGIITGIPNGRVFWRNTKTGVEVEIPNGNGTAHPPDIAVQEYGFDALKDVPLYTFWK